jgi:hypothetical protein
MVAVIFPLEFLVVDASSHGTALGLLLLGLEALLAAIVYLGALRLVAPENFAELMSLLRRMIRRRSPEDDQQSEPAEPLDETSTEAPIP